LRFATIMDRAAYPHGCAALLRCAGIVMGSLMRFDRPGAGRLNARDPQAAAFEPGAGLPSMKS